MIKTLLTVLMIALYSVLIACGTPGPLYIPEQRYPLPQTEVEKTPNLKTDNASTNQ
ncbi:MAG: hypothetical protein P8O76_00055 [Methylophilaceae bacterium]|nr:hypothetical protein [Methylophilaceae bacterium]